MIKQEILESGLIKTYSDNGKYIIQNEIEPIENLTTEETNDDCI